MICSGGRPPSIVQETMSDGAGGVAGGASPFDSFVRHGGGEELLGGGTECHGSASGESGVGGDDGGEILRASGCSTTLPRAPHHLPQRSPSGSLRMESESCAAGKIWTVGIFLLNPHKPGDQAPFVCSSHIIFSILSIPKVSSVCEICPYRYAKSTSLYLFFLCKLVQTWNEIVLVKLSLYF